MRPSQKQQTKREHVRSFLSALVSDWRPLGTDWWLTKQQTLWTIRIATVLSILVSIGYLFGITLWDWAKLLIIPVMIAAGGVWLNRRQQERDQRNTERRTQDEILQTYLDQMSALLLDRKLREPKEGEEARTLARSRTTTAFKRLDAEHNRSLLYFLRDSHLISGPENPIISFSGADLRDVNLRGANLRRVALMSADLEGADLSDADLGGANLGGANLKGASLFGAELQGTDLKGANLQDANLTGSRWRGYGANLFGADLREADLREANLRGANLQEANLRGANLQMADLTNAALLVSDLREADLSDANLTGAMVNNLQDANLARANLTGIYASTEQLEQAKSLLGATAPDGQKYEVYWDKSDPNVHVLRRQDGTCIGTFSVSGAMEDVKDAAEKDARVFLREHPYVPPWENGSQS